MTEVYVKSINIKILVLSPMKCDIELFNYICIYFLRVAERQILRTSGCQYFNTRNVILFNIGVVAKYFSLNFPYKYNK